MTEPLGRVAVFWHYDNLPPPSIGGSPRAVSRATYDSVFNIRQVLYKFGIIGCFRAYVGSMSPHAKWELQSHGITVVECLWNASETMITADMFQFALDNPSPGTTLVLISSSSTLGYTVSSLRARRYRVALISKPVPHNDVLLEQASEIIDWRCLLSRGDPRPVGAPSPMQDSSDGSSPGYTGIEFNPRRGRADFPQRTTETLENSFTISDLNLAGKSGGRPGSPPTDPNSAQLELQKLPPLGGNPPPRQIEEAIVDSPVVEDAEEPFGPRSFDSSGRLISLLNRPFNRSVSEPALRRNPSIVRPRTNSLQDDWRTESPSRKLTLEDHIIMRSLPLPHPPPLSFGGFEFWQPFDVEARPFIPSLDMTIPPEDAASRFTPTTKPAEGTLPPPVRLETWGPASLTPSSWSTPSTVNAVVAPATTTTKSEPPTQRGFTKAERRAVETVINVLLEMKGKGEARVSIKSLPHLILAKDRTVYKGVGSRGNRFQKLIDLGIQMGWLETGPENAWIDVGKGWTEGIDNL